MNIKRSVFIGHAAHCESEEKAKEFIREISRRFKDATHNCWAYKVNMNGVEKFNFSDAGEPHGSAGRPIFSAIESLNMTNIVVVVTRYFGGIKLGVRGLIDAYNSTARKTLEMGQKGKYCPGKRFSIEIDYSMWNTFIGKFAQGKDFNIVDVEYGTSVRATLTCKSENFKALADFFVERRIPIEELGRVVFVERL
ncbi:hypothetical protein IX53_09715 [Kosmotoga pacifica]|uniref:Impact N-terminal domain-containing protein n=2 Tax=Kosmotoga pacifica TaxID=1330330 RepID=A0A0G2ZFM5_9BACT|nr:hypothetical protein IX53_09715 [Kosmotoga pacifica]